MNIARALYDHEASEWLDADGRPLGEHAEPEAYARAGIREVACPYGDRRHGLPMNEAALEQVRSVWSGVLAHLRALSDGPRVHDAWRASIGALAAPLHWRSVRPGPVPVELASLFRVGLGYSQVLTAMLLADEGLADASLAELGDGGDLIDFLDAGGWLVGKVQACAGPPAMIRAGWAALQGGGRPLDPGLRSVRDEAVVTAGLCAVLIGAAAERDRAGTGDDGALGPRLRAAGRAPFLRAVAAGPGRTATHALRLFPANAAPKSVHRLLECDAGSDREQERQFRAIVAGEFG